MFHSNLFKTTRAPPTPDLMQILDDEVSLAQEFPVTNAPSGILKIVY